MRKLSLAAVLVLMASGAQAATLDIVGGQLMGASGVLVDGNPYDVEFVDGTCIDLFSGCDEASDFTFHTLSESMAASQALIDQVYNEALASPYLPSAPLTDFLNGVESTEEGIIYTPFFNPAYGYHVSNSMEFWFDGSAGADVVDSCSNHDRPGFRPCPAPSYDTTTSPIYVYAQWSVVPEPSTGLLGGLGLAGLAGKGRRRNRS